jgi:hypothetical protein
MGLNQLAGTLWPELRAIGCITQCAYAFPAGSRNLLKE